MLLINKSKRNSNIELLRVISMLMIVTLHYLYNGGVLDKLIFGQNNYFVSWLIESFCYVSVNCYVLISGYFLSTAKEIKISKIIETVIEVVFYSVGIYIVFCVIGIESFSVSTLVTGYLFPIIHGEYWFATVYIVLFLITPFLNKMLQNLEKNEHKRLLLILCMAFSVIPSVFFFSGESLGVSSGYSLIWFLFLYFLAAYIRKYPVEIKKIWLVVVFLGASLLNFIVKVVQQMILHKELINLYKYSSITVLVASLALFMLFIQMKPRYNRIWQLIGSCTFGVFLIHTQYVFRDKVLWDMIVKPTEYCNGSALTFILHMAISVSAIFVICCMIDLIRQLVFSSIKQLFKKVKT